MIEVGRWLVADWDVLSASVLWIMRRFRGWTVTMAVSSIKSAVGVEFGLMRGGAIGVVGGKQDFG
jgi:hypothetical protein